jgi:anti-sigma regulatory factor (Ser/Thr protein kinase)
MDPQAPSRARDFVRQAYCDEHNASVLDEAALLVSELVTNAIRHGSPPLTTEVECVGTQGMQVRVSDGNPAVPAVRAATPDAESGRGTALVDLLSDAWGVEPMDHGKAVWFRLKA